MSATLSKTLRSKYGVRSLPIRKDDEVVVLRGARKGNKGKVIQVHRKKWAIHIDKVTKNKANGAPYQIGIHPSNVAITKVKEAKDRLARITNVAAGVAARKGKADKKIKTTN
jgi:large subunit ribosomal protein L26e